MTDSDPLQQPPTEGSELPARVARDQGGDRPREGIRMDGPTGHAPATESAGDADRHSVASGGEAGAGGGAIAGAAVAGPIGLPIGAAIGAAAGGAAEAADVDKDTNEGGAMTEPGTRGTAPVDPGKAGGMPAERRGDDPSGG
jgi:hypothetical protein